MAEPIEPASQDERIVAAVRAALAFKQPDGLNQAA
jgi:hypothetical protein